MVTNNAWNSQDPAQVALGGTGRATLTNHGVLVGASTSAITQLAAGSAGQVLQSGGASADPAYSTATYPVTAGTAGNLLKSDGTNIVSAAASGVGASLVLLSSQVASNVASINFTSLISATYNNYLLVWSNVRSITATQLFQMNVSTNNGSSYLGSGYLSGINTNTYNSNTVQNTNSTSTALLANTMGQTTAYGSLGFVYICPNAANVACSITGQSISVSNATPQLNAITAWNSNTGVNAFQVLFASGNIDTGNFTLYGIAN